MEHESRFGVGAERSKGKSNMGAKVLSKGWECGPSLRDKSELELKGKMHPGLWRPQMPEEYMKLDCC